jgi:hypothetical protein
VTYSCTPCGISWFPYMTLSGACPMCGGGTRRGSDPASEGVVDLHRELTIARTERELSARRHRDFEAYCEQRDALEAAAALADLPVCPGPEQWGEEDVAA